MKKDLRRAEDILAYFSQRDLDPESKKFLRYHFRRYEFLFQKIDRVITNLSLASGQRSIKILDIGPGFQTEIMRQTLPGAVVNTLGFRDLRFQARAEEQHFEFDLNNAQIPDKWLKLEQHDLVIIAEVLEHLYTSPGLVLQCVASWMAPGGFLILQTPNACALHKRLIMLSGKNPFDLIRDTPENPGHFREYTLSELVHFTDQAGLRLVELATWNYFDNGSWVHKIYNVTSRVMPASLRQGITMTLQKI